MRFEPKLYGDAAALAQAHQGLVEALPATFAASILIELEKWHALFAAEQAYQRALLQHLAAMAEPQRRQLFAGLTGVEADAGCDRIRATQPARFQEEAQAALRGRRLLTRWRGEIQTVFDAVQPAIDRELHPPDAPRRLIVQMYASGIAIQAEQLWSRFKGMGTRVPLALDGARGSEPFLRALFGAGASTLFAAVRGAAGATPLDAWVIESGAALHIHGGDAQPAGPGGRTHTGLSYERLRGYRDELTRALYQKIQAGVESPQAFAAYARSLRIAPPPGALLDDSDALQGFVRDTFLTGNGTLFVNNTFVEWASVQALRRVQPRLLVARYGVRDKMKPFSSLLLFSQPRATDQIPEIEDPYGSFIDVEQLAYYVWLNAGKNAAYRQRTLHLLLADGVDELLAIRPDAAPGAAPARLASAATPADVCATMAAWLGVQAPAGGGTPIREFTA
jgi:hypothetical protein